MLSIFVSLSLDTEGTHQFSFRLERIPRHCTRSVTYGNIMQLWRMYVLLQIERNNTKKNCFFRSVQLQNLQSFSKFVCSFVYISVKGRNPYSSYLSSSYFFFHKFILSCCCIFFVSSYLWWGNFRLFIILFLRVKLIPFLIT